MIIDLKIDLFIRIRVRFSQTRMQLMRWIQRILIAE